MADGTLAQSVIGIAQQSNQNIAQTGNDALQAYHIAATAEHARQELEMQKQDQDMNKAKWFSSQVDNLQRMEDGPARKVLIDGLSKQLPQVYPNFNPDNLELLKHRPDLTPALATIAANALNGKDYQPGDLEKLTAAHGSDFMAELEKQRQAKLGELGAQAKAAAVSNQGAGRVGAMMDNGTRAAVQAIHGAPEIKNLIGQDFSLNKARGILNDPNHTPSWIELDESMQDAAKVLNGGQVGSDMKLKQLQQSMFDKDTGHIVGYLSSNPDQPASPQAIAFANHFVGRLSGQIDGQLSQAANRHAAGMKSQFYNNPNMAPAVADAIKSYKDGSWRGDPNVAAAQAPAQDQTSSAQTQTQTPSGPPPGSVIRHKDGTRYKVGDDGKTLTEVK